jgi:Uma2 family endonuclease
MQAIAKPVHIHFSPLQRRYTLEEFWDLPEREDRVRYELIGGYLFMVLPPNPPHGDLAANMMLALMKFLLVNEIKGKVHFPPETIWRCAEGSTSLEPDLMYVSDELREQMGQERTSADIVLSFFLKVPSFTIAPRKQTRTSRSA